MFPDATNAGIIDVMPRPIWSGAISFGLVSIPVKLFNAVSKKSVSFNQIDSRNGSRIKLKKTNAETGEDVDDDDIVKGYEITKGQYVVVDPDELDQFVPTATRTIDIEEFVDLDQIDPIYFDSPYYVAPDKVAKPYALLARAMADTNKVGIARFVMRGKQYVAAVRSADGHLILSTMVYADEVVDAGGIDEITEAERVEIADRELTMATQLVESLAGDFVPDRFHDTYREQVLDLIEQKASGEEWTAPEREEAAPKVIDLMAALEASVAAAKEARQRHPTVGATKPVTAAKKKATARKAAAALPAKQATATTRKKKSA